MCVMFQGRITVTGQLDREKGDMYTLTVVADDGGPKKDSTVVRFTLNCLILSPLFSCKTFWFLQHVLCLFCYRKLNGIPLLFIASLIGSAEGKMSVLLKWFNERQHEMYSSAASCISRLWLIIDLQGKYFIDLASYGA